MFGSAVAKKFLPHMGEVLRSAQAKEKGLERAVGRLFLDYAPHNSRPEQLCIDCLDIACTVWLLTAPPGGRGWRPGSMFSTVIFAHEVNEPPVVNGEFHPGDPAGEARCDCCIAYGLVYRSAFYVSSSETRQEHRWSFLKENGDRRGWNGVTGVFGPEIIWHKNAPEDMSGDVDWMIVVAKQAAPVITEQGRFSAKTSVARLQYLEAYICARSTLAQAIHIAFGTQFDPQLNRHPAAIQTAWDNLDGASRDDVMNALLVVAPFPTGNSIKDQAIVDLIGRRYS